MNETFVNADYGNLVYPLKTQVLDVGKTCFEYCNQVDSYLYYLVFFIFVLNLAIYFGQEYLNYKGKKVNLFLFMILSNIILSGLVFAYMSRLI